MANRGKRKRILTRRKNEQRRKIEQARIIDGLINPIDRLTSLPDTILADIVNRLPIKSAVATSALSWRWRRFWTQMTVIRDDGFRMPEFFIMAADKVLPKLASKEIDAFEFRGAYPFDPQRKHFSRLISRICSRFVKKIDIRFCVIDAHSRIPLPCCVFECESLEVLILDEGLEFELPEDGIWLPNLMELNVTVCDRDFGFMISVINSSPELEKLEIKGEFVNFRHRVDINCPNLKWLKLIMCHRKPEGLDPKIVIDAPKLEFLDIGGPHLSRCHHFVHAPISLVTAKIHTSMSCGMGDQQNLIQSIDHVNSLTLGGDIFLTLANIDGEAIPTFYGLTTVTAMMRHFSKCWDGLMNLLHHCPSLQVLVLNRDHCDWDGLAFFGWDSLPTCLSTTVKRIKLQCLLGVDHELKLIKFILTIAKVLETLNVDLAGSSMTTEAVKLRQEMDFCDRLCKLQRSSGSCKITLTGQYYRGIH